MPASPTWTQQQYYKAVVFTQEDYPDWRRGQVMFNVLNAFDPELADMIRGTLEDPFYRDERIPAFEALLWGSQPKEATS